MTIEDMKAMHLFRGAPAVRDWSKYQETVTHWSLCGLKDDRKRFDGTEEPAKVTCWGCLQLLKPKPPQKAAPRPQEAGQRIAQAEEDK
jgi:hypothetical protein